MNGLQWSLDTYMKRKVLETKNLNFENRPSMLSDKSVIEKAMNSKTRNKFKKLWNGDISDYPSQSEADLGLVSILAFYCNGNKEQIDRLFRQSALFRSKWDEINLWGNDDS